MATQLTSKQRIERARVALLRSPKWQHLAGILMLGETTITDTPGLTARTNGRDTEYGDAFVKSITDAQLQGLILHESFHVMYKQLTVWVRLWQEDPDLANRAADYVINIPILDAGHELPPGGCVDMSFRGLDTQQVFRKLQQQGQQGRGGGGKPGDGEGDGEGFDEHDWKGAQELTKAEQQELVREIDAALREGAILAGRAGGKLDRNIGELLAPKIDWREALREFVQTAIKGNEYSTWRRPNRRHLHNDVYLPSSLSDTMGHMVMGIDTSGSVGGREMAAFIAEVVGVCNTVEPEKLDLLYWDAAIAGHEHYDGAQCKDLAATTKPRGGGGTNVCVVFDRIKKEGWTPQCLVVLTDGYTPWPQQAPPYPVMWVMTTNVIAPFGVSLRID